MRKLYILGTFLFISSIILGQSGKISGKIVNAGSGQGLVGATLTLIETSKTISADQNGDFTFSKLTAGTYSIKCSYTNHIEKVIDQIVVINDESTLISISLVEKESDAVVVSAKISARKETVSALLTAQKNMANVSDFVSAEQIRKTPDRSTSDVIKRVSGASIQDDRFAIIRGLNDRYNAAFINGAPLPSTESDRKAFAFDIFPSAILDNLVIYKTATPDKSGEFAGGLIDITTKSIPSKNFTSISFSGSYNTIITGKERFFSDNKGNKDWIGLDDGTRSLPNGFPTSLEVRNVLTPAQKADLTKHFANYKWGVQKGTAKPNYNFQLSKGFNFQRKDKEFLGALFSLNYNRNFTLSAGQRNSFDQYDFRASYYAPLQRGKFMDSIYNDEVVVAALASFSVKVNNRNTFYWKNNLSINTDNKLIKRIGAPDFADDPDFFFKDVVRWFTSNQIYTSQLGGEHTAGPVKTKLSWIAGYSKVDRKIPNLSRTTYTGRLPDLDNLGAFFINNPNQTVGSGTMFFSNSEEDIKSLKADITQPYTFMQNSQNFIKIGSGYQRRERDFTSRTLGFAPYNFGSVSFDNSLTFLPEDQILLPEHFGIMKNGKGGFLIQDGTLPNSDYSASSSILHAYIMSDQRFFKKFRLIYGVRMEQFNQKLIAFKNLIDTINLNTKVTDFLPSVNFVYSVNSKINLRLSYASTINRPEFRELAPFLFYDYVSGYNVSGQSTLVRAKIRNYDFRVEFFPGRSQLFSISGFYKEFTDPLEFVTLPNTTSQAVYVNSTSGKVYGVEAEFRTLLSTLFGIKKENAFLSKFTWSANGAFMKSSVKLEGLFGLPLSQLVTDRALQGQSPYIINTSLGYNDEKTGISSTLSVNRVGDRVAIGGTYNVPDIYEKARTVVDFQLAKSFMKNALELKVNAKDILAQHLNFYFDFDRSKSYSDKDRYFSYYKAPQIVSISATLKF